MKALNRFHWQHDNHAGIYLSNAATLSKQWGLLQKGVVAYTLLASHVPLSARIIGANEHESHYVFDVLFNNLTDIQPDTHSTGTHGANQVNFALLHLFGYRFAPRYRIFRRKIRTGLYGFKHPNAYAGCALKPVRRIKENLIANVVVFYNSAILSEVLSVVKKQADTALVKSLQRFTPLAWQHINFYGRYRFDSDLRLIKLEECHLSWPIPVSNIDNNRLRYPVPYCTFSGVWAK